MPKEDLLEDLFGYTSDAEEEKSQGFGLSPGEAIEIIPSTPRTAPNIAPTSSLLRNPLSLFESLESTLKVSHKDFFKSCKNLFVLPYDLYYFAIELAVQTRYGKTKKHFPRHANSGASQFCYFFGSFLIAHLLSFCEQKK